MQKNETEHLYHTQNSTQNLKDLKTRSETIKLLEENIMTLVSATIS